MHGIQASVNTLDILTITSLRMKDNLSRQQSQQKKLIQSSGQGGGHANTYLTVYLVKSVPSQVQHQGATFSIRAATPAAAYYLITSNAFKRFVAAPPCCSV